MSFISIFNMYCLLMEENSLRHEDLIKPICDYAKSVGKSPSEIVVTLTSVYFRI